MVSVRNAILICIITRLAWDATSYVANELFDGFSKITPLDQNKTMCEELFEETGEMFPINEFEDDAKKCWCFHHDDGPKLYQNSIDRDPFTEMMSLIGDTPDLSITEKLWMELEMRDPEKYINGATVLCVMLGLNREWFQNLFHVGLIIMSLLYDPVVAIGVYGYIVLTPTQDEHVA